MRSCAALHPEDSLQPWTHELSDLTDQSKGMPN